MAGRDEHRKPSLTALSSYYTTDVDRFVEAAPAGLRRLAEANCRPASTLLGVVRLFHPAILVEIEATAMV